MDWEKERIHLQETILSSDFDFDEMALKIFHLQYKFNPVYRQYLDKLRLNPKDIKELEDIPFLPIQFFKYQLIQTGTYQPEKVFQSSGTTGMQRSSHAIRSLLWYKRVAVQCFEYAFCQCTVMNRNHLAFLPSYMDNNASSLLFMIQTFIKAGGGGFYHEEMDKLIEALSQNNPGVQPVLWGVSYALYQWPVTLDLAGKVQIIETGGMKGRGKEMIRSALHDRIKANFGVLEVFSEYGMTEMLSQAYTSSNGRFRIPPTLKVIPRSITDPLSMESIAQTAALNIIDLANLDSCCFIATEDIGKVYSNGDFEVLGRLDNSDIRGCNLLIS